jgi:hypothetical protein
MKLLCPRFPGSQGEVTSVRKGENEMPQYICQHGSCGVYLDPKEGVLINGGGYKVRFCCWDHAAKWALAMAAKLESPENRAKYFLALAELEPKKAVKA